MAFIMLRYVSFIPNLLRVFYHKRILYFVKCFSVSIEIIMWFLSFILLMWCITFIDLHVLNHFCIVWINPTWSGVYFFWCVLESSLLTFCWELLLLYSSGILVYSFLFCGILIWFWCQGNAGIIEWALNYSFLLDILEEIEKYWC